MLVPVKWLKEYVDFEIDSKELADRLTMSGSHVDSIESIDKAEQISLESLPSFNPDHLFLEVGNSEEDLEAQTDLETYAATSVWKNLTAVKSGQVYNVPHWTISDYPLIKENSLNLIVQELTNVE